MKIPGNHGQPIDVNQNSSDGAPAGVDHRLVGEDAERPENKTPTDIADSSRVGQTEDGVKLERMIALLRCQAEKSESVYEIELNWGFRPPKELLADAAACREKASELEAAPCAQPLTKSDSEEGEPCAVCWGRGKIIRRGVGRVPCSLCRGTGSRMNDSEGVEEPPRITPDLAAEIRAEQDHGRQKYGRGADDFEHDDLTPADNWHEYIADHNSRAKLGTPMERRQYLIKVAGLAISAIEAFDRRRGKRMSGACLPNAESSRDGENTESN